MGNFPATYNNPKNHTFPPGGCHTRLVFFPAQFAVLPCYLVVLCWLTGVFPADRSFSLDQFERLTTLHVAA